MYLSRNCIKFRTFDVTDNLLVEKSLICKRKKTNFSLETHDQHFFHISTIASECVYVLNKVCKLDSAVLKGCILTQRNNAVTLDSCLCCRERMYLILYMTKSRHF